MGEKAASPVTGFLIFLLLWRQLTRVIHMKKKKKKKKKKKFSNLKVRILNIVTINNMVYKKSLNLQKMAESTIFILTSQIHVANTEDAGQALSEILVDETVVAHIHTAS